MPCRQFLQDANDLTLTRRSIRPSLTEAPTTNGGLEELDQDAPRRWGRMVQVSRDTPRIQLNHDLLRLRPRQTERRTTDRQYDRRQNKSVAAVVQAMQRHVTRMDGSGVP